MRSVLGAVVAAVAGLTSACAPTVKDLTPKKFPVVVTEYVPTVSEYMSGAYGPHLKEWTGANRFLAHIQRANSVTITVNGAPASMQRAAPGLNLYIYDAPDQCVKSYAYSIVARNGWGTASSPSPSAPRVVDVPDYGKVFWFPAGYGATFDTLYFTQRLTERTAIVRHLAPGKTLSISSVVLSGAQFSAVQLPSTPTTLSCGTSVPIKVTYSSSSTTVGTVDTGSIVLSGTLDNAPWTITINLQGRVEGEPI